MGQKSENDAYEMYRREVEGGVLARSLRTGILLVVLLNTAFILLDFWAQQSMFLELAITRSVWSAAMLGILAGMRSLGARRAAYLGCLAAGAGLIAIITVAGGTASAYYPGLMLLFLGMPVLLPFSAREAGALVGTILLVFLVTPLMMQGSVSIDSYSLYAFFPAAAAVECVASCAVLERMRFRDYCQRVELEQAQDDLKELDRVKSRFTANLHHELRTPLTLILAPIEAIQSGGLGAVSEAASRALATAYTNGNRLLKLINNLLDLAKIEGHQLELSKRSVDMAGFVADVVSSAEPLAARKGVELYASESLGPTVVSADPDALDKVLINLIGNALKFSDRGGSVRLDVSCGMGGVLVAVTDTGIGVPADELERIFDRFAQVDASATRKHEGTGIGLSLVRELVELHGGFVAASSRGLGHGTTIRFWIPSAPEATRDGAMEPGSRIDQGSLAAIGADLDTQRTGDRLVEVERSVSRYEAAEVGNEPVTESGAGPDVLVVDDNYEMRETLSHLLGREFVVRTAGNGREALASIAARRPDLVLTDVMMPVMSGIELCAELKGDASTRSVPVVLLTSKGDREMKVEGLEAGADDYVTKPFHSRELVARIGNLVRMRGLQRELSDRNADLVSANADLQRALQELKEAEVQLVQAERLAAVGELAAGVAHEANNPLNFAQNSLGPLLENVRSVERLTKELAGLDLSGSDLPDRVRELLVGEFRVEEVFEELEELTGIVEEGLLRTSRLVGGLRDFAAPERKGGRAELGACVRSTVGLLGHAFGSQGVQVRVDIPAGLPVVEIAPQLVNQVLLNLLKNSLQALEGTEGGEVRVSVSSNGTLAVLEVRDTGPGVDPAISDHIFEPFVTAREAGRGTGLGLSICRRIVREHGGDIRIESRPGDGTVVKVTLAHRAVADDPAG